MASNPRLADAQLGRRRFLQSLAGAAALLLGANESAAQTAYRVGVGRSTDGYEATMRAVTASAEWPAAMAGRTVVIKPNLVSSRPATSGVTTDPQVVRALVDLALADGAAEIVVVEGEGSHLNFSACGYDFFNTYAGGERVRLLDLSTQPFALAPVPNGMVYERIHMPALALRDDIVYISVAKLKSHINAFATLTLKNSFGLPPIAPYQSEWFAARWAMHRRGVHETTVDINLVRPIDFAVVDGVWGLEGDGPLDGTPVPLNTVLAGRNALAVDRVGVAAMRFPQAAVRHLTYAAQRGLGPAGLDQIELRGDTLVSHPFVPAMRSPVIDHPVVDPGVFTPALGQAVWTSYGLDMACWTRADIVRASEAGPEVEQVRALRDWELRPAGPELLRWDGRDDSGQVAPAGTYLLRVNAYNAANHVEAFTTRRVAVTTPRVFLPAVEAG